MYVLDCELGVEVFAGEIHSQLPGFIKLQNEYEAPTALLNYHYR